MFSVYLLLAWALDGAATHASVKQVGPQSIKKIWTESLLRDRITRKIYYLLH
jgi:hypothetical protein